MDNYLDHLMLLLSLPLLVSKYNTVYVARSSDFINYAQSLSNIVVDGD